MFITDPWMQDRLSRLDRIVRKGTRNAVRPEEYIALPAFGQIMARFQTDAPITLAQVDQWERNIQALAEDEFMIDFMGNVYRQLGVDYARLDAVLARLGQRFRDEPMEPGPYADRIQADARELLDRCDLSGTTPVWEIQWEGGAYVLLLMGKANRPVGTIPGTPPVHLFEADSALCENLMRAAFEARHRGVSLGRLLLEAMEA